MILEKIIWRHKMIIAYIGEYDFNSVFYQLRSIDIVNINKPYDKMLNQVLKSCSVLVVYEPMVNLSEVDLFYGEIIESNPHFPILIFSKKGEITSNLDNIQPTHFHSIRDKYYIIIATSAKYYKKEINRLEYEYNNLIAKENKTEKEVCRMIELNKTLSTFGEIVRFSEQEVYELLYKKIDDLISDTNNLLKLLEGTNK